MINKELGNYFQPGAVATNMPLTIDKPANIGIQNFCVKCHICADYCPSGAIGHGGKIVVCGIKRWAVDANVCHCYWAKLGGSCSICQAVCPWSHTDGIMHDTLCELSRRFPLLRKAFIKGETVFYRYRPAAQPDRIESPGFTPGTDLCG